MKNVLRPVSAEELLHMPDNGMRRELVRGEVIEMSPAGGRHGKTAVTILVALESFIRKRKLGELFAAETGFWIERDPDTVRAPDCAFVRTDRLPRPIPTGFIPSVPDLAVEVLSPNDRAGRVADKVAQWLSGGVRLVWVIDPARRKVAVHKLGGGPETLGEDGSLDGGDVLPGFKFRIAELFEAPA